MGIVDKTVYTGVGAATGGLAGFLAPIVVGAIGGAAIAAGGAAIVAGVVALMGASLAVSIGGAALVGAGIGGVIGGVSGSTVLGWLGMGVGAVAGFNKNRDKEKALAPVMEAQIREDERSRVLDQLAARQATASGFDNPNTKTTNADQVQAAKAAAQAAGQTPTPA